MEYVASYLLCVENQLTPTKDNIAKLLMCVGASSDEATLNDFMSKVDGKTREEIISAGAAMMTLRQAAAPAATASAASTQAAPKAAEKVEEVSENLEIDFI